VRNGNITTKRVGLETLQHTIKEKKNTWLGHVLRIKDHTDYTDYTVETERLREIA